MNLFHRTWSKSLRQLLIFFVVIVVVSFPIQGVTIPTQTHDATETSTPQPTSSPDATTDSHVNTPVCVPAAASAAADAGGGKTFPTFPKAYSVSVQARFNGAIFNYLEDFDADLTIGSRRFMTSPPRMEIFNLKPGIRELYLVEGKDCRTISLSNFDEVRSASIIPDLRFFFAKVSVNNFGFEQYLVFGLEAVAKRFVGLATEFEGLQVEKWSACVHDGRTVQDDTTLMKLEYYFFVAQDGARVPLRVDVKGQTKDGLSRDFEYSLDFTFYDPKARGALYPGTALQTPPGVFCEMKSYPVYAYHANIAPIYSLKSEGVVMKSTWTKPIVINYKEYYDRSSKVYRRDFPPHRDLLLTFGADELSLIQDFNHGVEYFVDILNGNCTGPRWISDNRMYSVGKLDDSHKATMMSTEEMFNFRQSRWSRVGRRKTRGLDSDVWIARRQQPRDGASNRKTEWLNVTTEIHFGSRDPSDWPHFSDDVPLFLSINMEGKNGSEILQESVSVSYYDYRAEAPPYGTFDVGLCYEWHKRRNLVFRSFGKLSSIVGPHGNYSDKAKRLMTQTLSRWTKAPPTRISNVHFDDLVVDDRHVIDVWFTVLDRPKVEGSFRGEIGEVDLDTAVENVRRHTSNADVPASFYTVDGRKVFVVAGSLSSDEVVFDPRKVLPTKDVVGFSKGAMAGLGIGMFLIGALIGISIAYVMWKMHRGATPYSTF